MKKVFNVGAFGHISHFNGASWKHYYTNGEVPSFYGAYEAVAVKSTIVVSVGWIDNQGIVLRGYQMP